MAIRRIQSQTETTPERSSVLMAAVPGFHALVAEFRQGLRNLRRHGCQEARGFEGRQGQDHTIHFQDSIRGEHSPTVCRSWAQVIRLESGPGIVQLGDQAVGQGSDATFRHDARIQTFAPDAQEQTPVRLQAPQGGDGIYGEAIRCGCQEAEAQGWQQFRCEYRSQAPGHEGLQALVRHSLGLEGFQQDPQLR
jgi:hypothetical protein